MAYAQTISEDIRKFAEKNPRFEASLKMLNDTKFITLDTILLTYPDTLPENSQVIGVFLADIENIKSNKHRKFKQDYIVKHSDNSFTSYTKTNKPNKHVRPIEEFRDKIGAGKHYGTDSGGFDHWYNSIDDLPQDVESLVEQARKITQEITAQ
jgi:hypothetical protein